MRVGIGIDRVGVVVGGPECGGTSPAEPDAAEGLRSEAAGEEYHFPVHGGWPQPARIIRFQTEAGRTERSTSAAVAHRRKTVRVHGQFAWNEASGNAAKF